jgi:hypothetical protein
MQSQYGTSQVIGLVQLNFTTGVGGFILRSGYGAVTVARQGSGKYQFQLNTGLSDTMVAPIITQFSSVAGQALIETTVSWGNPTTPFAAGITEPANVFEIDFSGGDPAAGTIINVVFQTCTDVIDNVA